MWFFYVICYMKTFNSILDILFWGFFFGSLIEVYYSRSSLNWLWFTLLARLEIFFIFLCKIHSQERLHSGTSLYYCSHQLNCLLTKSQLCLFLNPFKLQKYCNWHNVFKIDMNAGEAALSIKAIGNCFLKTQRQTLKKEIYRDCELDMGVNNWKWLQRKIRGFYSQMFLKYLFCSILKSKQGIIDQGAAN